VRTKITPTEGVEKGSNIVFYGQKAHKSLCLCYLYTFHQKSYFMKRLFLLSVTLFLSASMLVGQEKQPVISQKIGGYTLHTLCEANRAGSIDILIGASPEVVREYAPDGIFPNAVNAFLLTSGCHNVLIDTGFGRNLFDNLKSVGLAPEDIDAIVITHMHGDHIGGMLRDDMAAFPKAEVFLSYAEYDYWMGDEAMNRLPEDKRGGFELARKVLAAYSGRVRLVEPAGFDGFKTMILKDFFAISAPGHTPGHTMVLLESEGEQLLIWGDLTHATSLQIAHPDVAVIYDVDPETAIKSRRATLNYLRQHDMPVAGMHIPYPGVLKSVKGE